jgi:hypothetical protein
LISEVRIPGCYVEQGLQVDVGWDLAFHDGVDDVGGEVVKA